MRKLIFNLLFKPAERLAIISALFRRADDMSTNNIRGDYQVRELCRKLGQELEG